MRRGSRSETHAICHAGSMPINNDRKLKSCIDRMKWRYIAGAGWLQHLWVDSGKSLCDSETKRKEFQKKNEASKSGHRFGTRNWQVFGGMANQKRKCELVSTSWLLRPLDHSFFPRVTKSAGGILYTFRLYSLLSCWFPVYTLNLGGIAVLAASENW